MKRTELRLMLVSLAALSLFLILDLMKMVRLQKNHLPADHQFQDLSDMTSKQQKRNVGDSDMRAEKEYTIQTCPCKRVGFAVSGAVDEKSTSTCSDYATQRGPNQNVFSYTYYNPKTRYLDDTFHNEKYLKGLLNRATEIKTYYPKWLMRIYHNVSTEDTQGNKILCQLFCSEKHVDLCDVSQLPVLGNLLRKQPIGRLWRFAVMGDPNIAIFNSRDTDSAILEREVDAVNEWLQSSRTYHVMRDHPRHKAVMLAGLWGAKNKKKLEELSMFRNKIFSRPANYSTKYDQFLLSTIVWPYIKNDTLQHDSFTCSIDTHSDSAPFPTERKNNLYIGWGPYKIKEREVVRRAVCPIECRPPSHKDWVQC